jgi:hypothetical protein
MPVLIDGNNLLHHLPGGQRRREEVRRLSLELIRREAVRVVVVFDGPSPQGTPPRELLGRLTIVYSGSRSADDVIIDTLPGGAGARQWTVVTDDLKLRDRARRQGAEVRSTGQWGRKLLGPGSEPADSRTSTSDKLSPSQVEEWSRYFASGRQDGTSARPATRTSSARRKK